MPYYARINEPLHPCLSLFEEKKKKVLENDWSYTISSLFLSTSLPAGDYYSLISTG